MYAKKKIKRLVAVMAPIIIKALDLKEWDIEYVYPPRKECKDKNLHGLTCMNYEKKKAQIIFYYTTCTGKMEAIDTIIHEFLHIKFAPICNISPHPLMPTREEEFIWSVSKFISLTVKKLLKKVENLE